MDADALDRVAFHEGHDILAELAIDPGQCWFDGEAPDDFAHSSCSRMEGDRRYDRPQGQKDQPGSSATELRIEFERPCDHGRRDDAARTVSDHNNLIGVIFLSGRHEAPRTDIDNLIEPSRLAPSEPAQGRPATGD